MKKLIATIMTLVILLVATPVYAWDENGTHFALAQTDPVAKELLYGEKGTQCSACHREGGSAHILPPDPYVNPTTPDTVTTSVNPSTPQTPAPKPAKRNTEKKATNEIKSNIKVLPKTSTKQNCYTCHPAINWCATCHSNIDWD